MSKHGVQGLVQLGRNAIDLIPKLEAKVAELESKVAELEKINARLNGSSG